MSDESSKRPVGAVGKKPEVAQRATGATTANSNHTYRLIYVSMSCTAYQVGDLVVVSVGDPPPDWTPINLGGDCTDCVGALDE